MSLFDDAINNLEMKIKNVEHEQTNDFRKLLLMSEISKEEFTHNTVKFPIDEQRAFVNSILEEFILDADVQKSLQNWDVLTKDEQVHCLECVYAYVTSSIPQNEILVCKTGDIHLGNPEMSSLGLSSTSITLFESLYGDDNIVWNRFISRYLPQIVSFAHRLGIPMSDCEDIGQQTLMAFIDVFRKGNYDHNKGKFRNFLFGIAMRYVHDFRKAMMKERLLVNETKNFTHLENVIDGKESVKKIWEEEWKQAFLKLSLTEAAKEFTPLTMALFESHVIRGESAQTVAKNLGTTCNFVYLAKHRVLSFLRQKKKQVDLE